MATGATGITSKSPTPSNNDAQDTSRLSSPAGVGGAPTTMASAAGSADSKRAPSPNPEEEKRPRTDPAAPLVAPAPVASISPLPSISDNQKEVFRRIYQILGRGSVADFIQFDSGWMGSKWITFDWIRFKNDLQKIKQDGEEVKDVHPLSFLAFMAQEHQMQKDLKAIRQHTYRDNWRDRLGKISSILNGLGVSTASPWERTIEDFQEDMKKCKEKGTLQLESFFKSIDASESLKERVQKQIEEERFKDLFNAILDR